MHATAINSSLDESVYLPKSFSKYDWKWLAENYLTVGEVAALGEESKEESA